MYKMSGAVASDKPAGWSGGYWVSLAALATRIEFFDFHSDVWDFYRNVPDFDLFMQAHLGHRCDEVLDGFIAFREIREVDKKEVCEGTSGWISYMYGDWDVCLYAPALADVDFQPVSNSELPGNTEDPESARGQYYVIGAASQGGYRHSRRLVSQFAYLDIDDALASRAEGGTTATGGGSGGSTGGAGGTAGSQCVNPPDTPSNPSPTHGATDVDREILKTIDWADTPGAESYDLYFGDSCPPPAYPDEAFRNVPSSERGVSNLAGSTEYCWLS